MPDPSGVYGIGPPYWHGWWLMDQLIWCPWSQNLRSLNLEAAMEGLRKDRFQTEWWHQPQHGAAFGVAFSVANWWEAKVEWIDFGSWSPGFTDGRLVGPGDHLYHRPQILGSWGRQSLILFMVLRPSKAFCLSKLHFQRFNALQAARSLLVWSMLEWMSYVTGRSREKDEKTQALWVFSCLDYSEVQKLAAKSWKFLHRSWDIHWNLWIQKDGLMTWLCPGCNMSHGDHEEQTMKLQNLSKAYQLRPEVRKSTS